MKRLSLCLILGIVALGSTFDGLAAGSDFPRKTITMVVPFSPGGGADSYVRLVVPYISRQLDNATIIVKNIPGGDMITGLSKIYQAKPDGYTLGLFMTPGQAVRQLTGTVDYDLMKVTWLGRIAKMDYIMALSPKSKFKTLKDLQNADKVLLGVANVSGAIGTLISSSKLNIKITPVTHRGSQEAMLSAFRGDVDFVQFPVGTLRPAIKAGDLTPILAFSKERLADFPNVPSIGELGHPEMADVVMIGYYLGGTPGIPAGIAGILKKGVEKALADKELHKKADAVHMPIINAGARETESDIRNILTSYAPYRDLLVKYLK